MAAECGISMNFQTCTRHLQAWGKTVHKRIEGLKNLFDRAT